MRYRVFGNTSVTVVTEVNAATEEEAYEKSFNQLSSLSAFCGNGGIDKLIGVSGKYNSVSADETITYDDIELIDDKEVDNDVE